MVKQNKEMRDKPLNALYTYTTASIGALVCGIDTRVKSTMQLPFLNMSWKSGEPSFDNNFKFAIGVLSPKLFRILRLKIFAGTIVAGTDTGANTMNFTPLELSNNPDVLQKLHKEIDKVVEEIKGQVTYDIDKLVYLNMVVNEAMKKYPPIGLIQRECMRDTVLPVGNLRVEKGVMAIIPTYAIHRDEKLFPNPDKFDPERFSPENAANFLHYGYLPFGEGRRICIDKHTT